MEAFEAAELTRKISHAQGWSHLDCFLHNHWAPAVHRFRYCIIVASLLLTGLSAAAIAATLVANDSPPRFFPAWHNLGLVWTISDKYLRYCPRPPPPWPALLPAWPSRSASAVGLPFAQTTA